jgi:hypothetical protein
MPNVAVSVISAKDAEAIRSKYRDAWIFAALLMGISREDVEGLSKVYDVITACASKQVRDGW